MPSPRAHWDAHAAGEMHLYPSALSRLPTTGWRCWRLSRSMISFAAVRPTPHRRDLRRLTVLVALLLAGPLMPAQRRRLRLALFGNLAVLVARTTAAAAMNTPAARAARFRTGSGSRRRPVSVPRLCAGSRGRAPAAPTPAQRGPKGSSCA